MGGRARVVASLPLARPASAPPPPPHPLHFRQVQALGALAGAGSSRICHAHESPLLVDCPSDLASKAQGPNLIYGTVSRSPFSRPRQTVTMLGRFARSAQRVSSLQKVSGGGVGGRVYACASLRGRDGSREIRGLRLAMRQPVGGHRDQCLARVGTPPPARRRASTHQLPYHPAPGSPHNTPRARHSALSPPPQRRGRRPLSRRAAQPSSRPSSRPRSTAWAAGMPALSSRARATPRR